MAINITQSIGIVQWELSHEATSGLVGLNNQHIHEIAPPILTGLRPISLADGTKHVSVKLLVKANAIIDKLDLILSANRADSIKAKQVADVRVAEGDNESIIIDFGMMLTVNSVSIATGYSISTIYPWLGTKFDKSDPLFEGDGVLTHNSVSFSDVKTQRLMLTLGSGQNAAEAIDFIELSLPDLPSGLTLRINGDRAIWQYDPMIQLGISEDITDDGWNSLGQRRVSLASSVAQYTQDPTKSDDVELEFVLSAIVPGALKIELESAEKRHIHRMSFNNKSDLALSFEREAEQQLVIFPPSNVTEPISGIELSISGELDRLRAIPALAQKPNEITELSLGKGRAACVRLDANLGLVELAGLRFPFISGPSGAEARVILWRERDGVPMEAITNAISEPINWTGSDEQWIRFDFKEPVALEENVNIWAAIHVNRGEVIWKMATANERNEYPVRIGSPGGPWRALPAIFGSGTSLGSIAGRVHMLGNADQMKPIPPLLISLDDDETQLTLTPTNENSRIGLEFNAQTTKPETNNIVLRIVSRSQGSIKISEVDVITGEKLS